MLAALTRVWTCFLLAWLLTETDGKPPDVQVTCLFHEACVLPCSFQPAGREEVHWFRKQVLVYSHPQSRKQLEEQSERRMSMSSQQLLAGNASLLLHHCGARDRGRYRCRVIRGQQKNDTFIVVKVVAPIRSVSLEPTCLSGYEEVKCSTRGVYPAPHVWWYTEPASPVDQLQPTTRKTADKRSGLYSVESKVRRLRDQPDLTYTCTLNTSYSSQTWRTSLTDKVLNNVTFTSKSSFTWTELCWAQGKDLTIPCSVPPDMQDFTLTWSFTRVDESVVIDTYDRGRRPTSSEGADRPRLDTHRVEAGDGSLRLLGPRAPEHAGTYTCTLSGLHRTHVAQTELSIVTPAGQMKRVRESATLWWVPATVSTTLIIIAAVIVGTLKLRDKRARTGTTSRTVDAHQRRVVVADTDVICGGS